MTDEIVVLEALGLIDVWLGDGGVVGCEITERGKEVMTEAMEVPA